MSLYDSQDPTCNNSQCFPVMLKITTHPCPAPPVPAHPLKPTMQPTALSSDIKEFPVSLSRTHWSSHLHCLAAYHCIPTLYSPPRLVCLGMLPSLFFVIRGPPLFGACLHVINTTHPLLMLTTKPCCECVQFLFQTRPINTFLHPQNLGLCDTEEH